MKILKPEELVAVQKWRYSTKIFDASKKISAPEWKALEESLILSPSSYGIQPWKFIVITDDATRQKLLPISWGQKQVTDCSHFVVFAGRTDINEADVDKWLECIRVSQKQDPVSLDKYKAFMMGDLVNGPRHAIIGEWIARQVYIALGNFMTSAALLGIDTCPMEGIDPAKYDEALNLRSRGYATKVACAAGYRSNDDKYGHLPKARFAPDQLIQKI